MTWQAKALGAKPGVLKSSPETRVEKEGNQFPQVFLWPPHMAWGTVTHRQIK